MTVKLSELPKFESIKSVSVRHRDVIYRMQLWVYEENKDSEVAQSRLLYLSYYVFDRNTGIIMKDRENNLVGCSHWEVIKSKLKHETKPKLSIWAAIFQIFGLRRN